MVEGVENLSSTPTSTILILKELSLRLISPSYQNDNRLPNPRVDLSRRGVPPPPAIVRKDNYPHPQFQTLTSTLTSGPCDICASDPNPRCGVMGSAALRVLVDRGVDLGGGDVNYSSSKKMVDKLICEDCSRLVDGIVGLAKRVELLQAQISGGILAIKTLIRLTLTHPRRTDDVGVDKRKESAGVGGKWMPSPSRSRIVRRKGPKTKSKTRTRNSRRRKDEDPIVGQENLDLVLGLEEEEPSSPPPRNMDDPWEPQILRDPLELEVKEEPLDFHDSDDWLEDDHHHLENAEEDGQSVGSLPGGISPKPDSEVGEGLEEESGNRPCRTTTRKSKIRAAQTLCRIVAEETTGSQRDDADDDESDQEDVMKPLKKRKFNPHPKKRAKSTSTFCPYCSLSFVSPAALRVHNRRLHDPHTCSICDPPMHFKCRKSWTDHVAAVHTGVRRHPCVHSPPCDKSFYKRSAAQEHSAVCLHNPNPPPIPKPVTMTTTTNYLCQFCGGSFKHKHTLRYHVLQMHQVLEAGLRTRAGEPKFTCPTCSKRFWTSVQYRGHLEGHQPLEERLVCDLCPGVAPGVTFKTLLERVEHTRRVHEGRVTHPCHLCAKRFTRPYYLRRHLQEQHAAREGMAARSVCDLCGSSFSGKNTLLRHSRYYVEKGLDCRKGVRKRSRVQGTLVGPPPDGSQSYKTSGGLGSEVIRQVVETMRQRKGPGGEEGVAVGGVGDERLQPRGCIMGGEFSSTVGIVEDGRGGGGGTPPPQPGIEAVMQ